MQPTTKQFDLPYGYTDQDGTVHKTVTMRRVTNRDYIAVANEKRIKELSSDSVAIDLNSVRELAFAESAGVHGADMAGTIDVVKLHRGQAAIAELNIALLDRVITRIGTIDNPGKEVLLDLTQYELGVLIAEYTKFNEPPVDKKKENDKVPFGQSAN